ncbi:hypothetical protein Sjap_022628 [Stephania japonica]|uniref:Uncharacterized protein n=1 Tax=Stephania japonica TaxID=461633 RepID=A0AAP0EP88_9MAGN
MTSDDRIPRDDGGYTSSNFATCRFSLYFFSSSSSVSLIEERANPNPNPNPNPNFTITPTKSIPFLIAWIHLHSNARSPRRHSFQGLHGYGFNDKMEGDNPYFVRRWASKLEKVVGENCAGVDWRRSFYLNLVAHTSYTVTVAICSIQDLRDRQNSEGAQIHPIYKEVETVPAYPDICFAVDDFDSTFGAVVLTETDQCYCVLLNAHDGAAFPSENGSSTSSSTTSSHVTNDSDSGKPNSSKFAFMLSSQYLFALFVLWLQLTVFSGFVSYQMVREAYDAGKSRFGSLLSASHSSGKTDRLYMKGPGGRGEVEVAVSGVTDQSQQVSDPPSPLHISRRGLGIGLGTIVRKAASVASVAAKHAYAAAATKRFDEELLPLNCCLMSISLPWEHIAHDLLFKGSPPVDL